MNEEINIKEKLKMIQTSEGDGFNFDEDTIDDEYQKRDLNKSSLSIKVLSILGGFIATLTFISFLAIAGLYKSEIGMLVLGVISIFSAVWLNKTYEKLIIDTLSISLYVIGVLMSAFGLLEMEVHENLVAFTLIVISIFTLVITQNFLLSFIAVLVINASFLSMLVINETYDLIHLYISLITILLTYFIINEAKIITSDKKFSRLYNPVRIGLIISMVLSLSSIGKRGLFPVTSDYIWISSIATIPIVMYLISIILNIIKINTLSARIKIYLVAAILLLPSAYSPAISGAIIILLLSFLVNYKTGIAIGIISIIYFISQYYYDLSFTLLVKSGILFSTGALFILCYLFTHKKLGENEEV